MKLRSLFLAWILLLFLCPLKAFAAEETADISGFALPKPEAPSYLVYEAADRTATEGDDALYVVRKADMSVLQLSAEEHADRDAFLAKYGLYDFTIVMQYDTSLDGTDNWSYTPEWDREYSAPGAGEAAGIFWIGGEMMEKQTVFDLYKCEPDGENYSKMADAIIRRDVTDGGNTFHSFYFDHEDHSLYLRVRYYMQWQTWDGETVGDTQSKYSAWSDAAVFGKDSNAITPDTPAAYEAPVISDLKYVPPGEGYELGYLTYIQATSEQVWEAGIYYEMTGDGYFEGLETQISVNGGQWQEYNTPDAWGDWCLWNGERTAYLEEPRIEADSQIKLRVRFLGTHGPSEWSNVLELNDGGTQEVPTQPGHKPADPPVPQGKCTLCGFCPVPLGLCVFIWLAILLAVVILLVILLLACKPKKCRRCGQKLKKHDRQCPNCGTPKK